MDQLGLIGHNHLLRLTKADPYGHGSASINDYGQSIPAGPCQQNHKKPVGLPTSKKTNHPKRQSFKGGRKKYKWNFVRPPRQNVQIQNELDLYHVHRTSVSPLEWNLPRPPNFVSHSTQVPSNFISHSIQAPNEKDLTMHHDKVGGKSYSWDFHLAPSASIPSCHSSL